ncbi:MAG: hypothetical protein RXR82_04570 [Nitrososphaeria archaeon]
MENGSSSRIALAALDSAINIWTTFLSPVLSSPARLSEAHLSPNSSSMRSAPAEPGRSPNSSLTRIQPGITGCAGTYAIPRS